MALPMNIFRRFTRRIELNNVCHFGEVQPTRRDVGTQKNAAICIAELYEGLCTRSLWKVPMQLKDWRGDEVLGRFIRRELSQGCVVEGDCITCRKEDNHLQTPSFIISTRMERDDGQS